MNCLYVNCLYESLETKRWKIGLETLYKTEEKKV